MDKLSIISQLELDINALQRLVEEFKNHPESISPAEWGLFVRRLQLMHEYCGQLKLDVHPVKEQEAKKESHTYGIHVPSENIPPVVNVPGIIAKETPYEEPIIEKKTISLPVERMEMAETPPLRDQQAEVIAYINTPVTEPKTSSQKQKKQIVSVGGLFGDTLSHADKFKDEPTIADKIAKAKSDKSVADKMQHKPVKDLKDAIGINEKFLFINELFDGNLQDYSEALNKLNAAESLQSAEEFIRVELSIRYNWTDHNDHVKNLGIWLSAGLVKE